MSSSPNPVTTTDGRTPGPGKKNRLGKGLGALLGEYLESDSSEELRRVPVGRIVPNPLQPRREFSEAELSELQSSIQANGLLQPLVVRPASPNAPQGADWELVAGERRWRCIRRLAWTEVPVVVREIDDRTLLVLAIVENVQRADLSPLEEAMAYRTLIDEFGLTQKAVAEQVNKDRSTVANLLRLLQLPASVQRLLSQEPARFSMGHARALLALPDERTITELAREVVARELSVRDVEKRVRERTRDDVSRVPDGRASGPHEPHLRHLEAELQRTLGTAARIRTSGSNRGRIEIPFFSRDDFERLVEILIGSEAARG
jgi:ParB family transcriptional regulator, chromosome partitioning protein